MTLSASIWSAVARGCLIVLAAFSLVVTYLAGEMAGNARGEQAMYEAFESFGCFLGRE